MSIGAKIRKLRDNKKLSQAELAERLGISQTSLCNVEIGDSKKIDFLLMDKICKEFDVDFDYFTDEKQINKVKTNQGAIAYNIETVNNFPENIVEQIKQLVNDNKQKELRIKELESLLIKK